MTNRESFSAQGNMVVLDDDYVLGSKVEGADVFCVASKPISIRIDVVDFPGANYNIVNRGDFPVTIISGAGQPFFTDTEETSFSLAAGAEARLVLDPVSGGWRASFTLLSGGGGAPVSASDITTALGYIPAAIDNMTGDLTASQTPNTDLVAEGATNKYQTNPRTLNTPLTGLSTVVESDVVADDSIIESVGKLQAQISKSRLVQQVLVAGVGVSGFLSDAEITDTHYPFADQNVDFVMGVSGQSVTLSPTGPIVFNDRAFDISVPDYISFPVQNVPLSAHVASFPAGISVSHLGINRFGTFFFRNTSFAQDPNIVDLGTCLVVNSGGVISFLTGLSSSVITRPNLFKNSNFLRAVCPLDVKCRLRAAALGLTMDHNGARIVGENIAWGTATPNVREIAPAINVPFRIVSPATFSGTTLPAPVTAVDPANYWTGSAVGPVPGSGSSTTVQKVMMSITGDIYIFYGSVVYEDLDTALSKADNEVFFNPFPPTFAREIARIALRKIVTDLSNKSYANIILSLF